MRPRRLPTLGSVSTTDGETSGRLDAALRAVFESAPTLPARDVDTPAPSGRHAEVSRADEPAESDDWSIDGPDDEPYELPEIVPATTGPIAAQPVARTAPPPVPPPIPTAPAMPAAPPRPTTPATGWGDHMSSVPPTAQGAPLRAPGRRPRVRRVTRVLRHIDPWSTFKVALLFSAVVYVVALTSGVLLWRVADSTGTLANVERWFTQFGWETFELKGGEIFRNAWMIGLFGAVGLTGALVLLATLFNLVSDIVGGVRVTVLEEEVVERTVSSARRYVVRRTPVASDGAAADDDWDVDGDAEEADVRGADTSPGRDRPSPAGHDEPTTRVSVADDDWSIDDERDHDRSEPG